MHKGARDVGGGLFPCHGRPVRRRYGACCAAGVERREGGLHLLVVRHALPHRWLLVRGLLFMQ